MNSENVNAIRALNISRLRHKPTYIALRSLFDFEDFETWSNHIAITAYHKLLGKKDWRYFTYPVVKDLNGGEPVYRTFMTGSPFTLVAESLVLGLLAKEKAFQKQDFVFSYLWPASAQTGRNYAFYREGYVRRNEAIRTALETDQGSIAVVNDIRKFYPSISWEFLAPKVGKRLSQIEDRQVHRIAEQFVGSFQEACKSHLAIGPDISHILADIALEHVDTEMSKRFPGRYFRYVDDIVVVCKRNEVDLVQAMLTDLLAPLELNEEKQDVVERSVWEDSCPLITEELSLSTFGGLTRAIELLLLHAPQKSDSIEARFREEGFSIPLRRLAIGTQYGRFKLFLDWMLDSNIRLISRLSIAELVEYAKSIKKTLIAELGALESAADGSKTKRRWFVQNSRFRLNRLLYLFTPREYDQLYKLIPDGAEFDEQRLVVKAILEDNPLSLLPYPGSAVNTYCEVMAEREMPKVPLRWPSLKGRPESETATMFAIYFGWDIPAESREQMFFGSRILLERFLDGKHDIQGIAEQSYLDEVELLLRDTSSEKRLTFARTRVSRSEIGVLEAFGLGDDCS